MWAVRHNAIAWSLLVLTLALAACGCTAFADAVDGGSGDGGEPDAGVGLIIEPVEYIRQGEKATYTIRFSVPPPWVDKVEDLQNCYKIKFDFVHLDDPDELFLDIDKVPDYCSEDSPDPEIIMAVMQADVDADTETSRLLVAEVGFDEDGLPQQTWTGSARFYVFPKTDAQDLDGGVGGDGGE